VGSLYPGRSLRPLGSWRTINIAALATVEQAINSAEFGVAMIEGVEKVRFINQRNQERPPYEFLLPSKIPRSINIW